MIKNAKIGVETAVVPECQKVPKCPKVEKHNTQHTTMTKVILFFLLLLSNGSVSHGFTAASAAVILKDHSAAAAGLFNNMRTPAALIAGAMVPIGLLTSPTVEKADSPRIKLFKRLHVLIAVASVLSELLAITYSTIAINKLAEVAYAPTATVAELISKHHELAWIGTNVNFLLGMFGFGLLVGFRAFINFGPVVGKIAGCWGIAGCLQCMSIVNRGIAMGSGSVENATSHFASNMFTLTLRYFQLVVGNAKGVLSVSALAILAYSLVLIAQFLNQSQKEAVKSN
jgi:hypothetical protein